MKLLYQITPTTVYIKLSTFYHRALEHLLQLEVDPKLWYAVNRGVLLGVAILSFLILFPGEPFDFLIKDDHATDKDTLKEEGNHKENVLKKNGKLKERQLQKEQKSDRVGDGDQVNVSFIMYIGFYSLLFVGGVFILDRSYGITFKHAFKHYLPREAVVLGF
jgi:hypothetical protein